MPGLVHHTLLIPLREGENKVISSGMILQPPKGIGVLKTLGQIGFRDAAIPQINGIASAVLGITGRSRNLCTFFSRLVPFRGHIEENRFLEIQ